MSKESGLCSERAFRGSAGFGAVAQLGERRFCKPEVEGSTPFSSIPSESKSQVEKERARLRACGSGPSGKRTLLASPRGFTSTTYPAGKAAAVPRRSLTTAYRVS